jgi:hypothetical protein
VAYNFHIPHGAEQLPTKNNCQRKNNLINFYKEDFPGSAASFYRAGLSSTI